MRAYLAQYLVKVEVPVEILSDTDVSGLYEQVGLFVNIWNIQKCWLENLNGIDHSEDLGIDRKVMLEWILGK